MGLFHQPLLYTSKHTILHGRKQLIWSFREKNQIGTHSFEIHYLRERKQSMKGLLAIAIPSYCWKREHVAFPVQCTIVELLACCSTTGLFQFGAIINKDTMNNSVKDFCEHFSFFFFMSRSMIDGSYDGYMFSFLKNLPNYFPE